MTQERALEILKTGANVFLTGEPGTGKTHVINQYTAWLQAAGIPTAVTASTGIAATHIGGFTIHSWSAVGTRDQLSAYDLDVILGKEYVVKRLKKTAVLVIDEISMLDGNILNMVDRILQSARGNTQPFGGVQIVLVGDFFQLPPITRNNEPIHYAFNSNAWQNAQPTVCYLTDQYRHEDELLSGLLSSVRKNTIDESHYTLLEEQQEIGYGDIEPTRLFTHNMAVDELNLTEIKKLSSTPKQYQMKSTGNKMLTEALVRSCLSPQTLLLAEEAMVMCTKNNFEAGYANGTLGRVIGFDSDTKFPIIRTTDEKEIVIKPATWNIQDNGKILAEIEQLPLRLAWAITVHKSQGMSLDAVEIDLSKAFAYGQGYVALSRVRTLMGLKVLGLNPNALLVDPKIVERDEKFRQEADTIDKELGKLSAEDLLKQQKEFVKLRGKRWPSKENLSNKEYKKPKSTYEETKDLLEAGNTLAQIAKSRELTQGTVVSHLETLLENKNIAKEKLAEFIKENLATKVDQDEILVTIEQYGPKKLKPLHEATKGKYDYITLRLVRLLYTAKNSG